MSTLVLTSRARIPLIIISSTAPSTRPPEQRSMGCVSCQGLPTKANSRVLFTCEKGYVATPDAWNQRRRRRGTSQHKTRETNAGGGGVRRNTRRVKPTRRRRSTSQHKTCDTNAGGGVCCHHSKLISYPHVFFPPKFSYFLYQSFNFLSFTFLCCDDIEYILDTNCVLHTKLYVINIISTLKKKTELSFLSLGD